MRSQAGEQRDAVLSAYIANDILGCASDIRHGVSDSQGNLFAKLHFTRNDLG